MSPPLARLLSTCGLAISLHREARGPAIAREMVAEEDLLDAASEAWRDRCLRGGFPNAALAETSMHLRPIHDLGDQRWGGFALDVSFAGRALGRQKFSIRSLQHAASRAAERLVADGTLSCGDRYYYRLIENQPPLVCDDASGDQPAPFSVRTKPQPLSLLQVPIGSIRTDASPVGSCEDHAYPVFYTHSAFENAERFSRRGAAAHPPVETGCVLVGPLCTCPATGELFAVICDVLEVTGAEQTPYTFYYTEQTWRRLEGLMRARRAHPATRSHRILGQSHGHNFLPADGAPPCTACSRSEVCGRTSAYASVEDMNWSRAVFSRQPWQLCHIFGLNARGEPVHNLFGLQDGLLQSRGFYVVETFDSFRWTA